MSGILAAVALFGIVGWLIYAMLTYKEKGKLGEPY